LGEAAFRAEVRRGSDALRGRTLSLRWAPASWLDLSASESRSRTPPSPDLLGEPLLETSGVRTFDPLRSETVDVVTLTGGLEGLPASRLRMRRLAADLRPLRGRDLLLTAEFQTTDSRNLLIALPPASAQAFRLFPERFTRAPDGRLLRVDLRPVLFPALKEEQVRVGSNLNLPLRRLAASARLQLAASYRLLLKSRLSPGEGSAPIDLLGRSSLGLGGMRPRHQIDFSLGYAERGLGLRLAGERRSRSFLDASPAAGPLVFGSLTTFNLRAFVEGQCLAPRSALLKGSRISLSVANLGNSREDVRSKAGETPLAFQPALRDPLGRTIEIELRKTF
jgi:hypothetical protein